MALQEYRDRQQVDTLRATLAAGWSIQYQRDVSVLPPNGNCNHVWRLQPLLSACCLPPVEKVVHQFLLDGFCATPVVWRRSVQQLVGHALTSQAGLSHCATPVFHTDVPCDHAQYLLVMPGNQRIRVYDFLSGTCRVIQKVGHSLKTLKQDAQIRKAGQVGPFVPILSWNCIEGWFEEPIVNAYALPRCPTHWNRQTLEFEAFARLSEWQASCGKTRVAVQEYGVSLLDRVHIALRALCGRPPGIEHERVAEWARTLATNSLKLGLIELAQTHGDFQPGNILVDKTTRQISIIDWEYSGTRCAMYDKFVYGLRSRPVQCLHQHCSEWLSSTRSLPGLADQPLDKDWRLASLSLFLLEDLIWYLEQNSERGYSTILSGLSAFLHELAQFGPHLEQLQRERM